MVSQEQVIVIDATDLLVGRLATHVAKAALRGARIEIVNCEKAAISGTKQRVMSNWKRKHSMGVPKKGPFIHRMPDRFVRRIIRGMLPHKQPRGRDAFARIMCHISVPEDLKDAKAITLDDANIKKLPNTRYVTISVICRELGGKWYGDEK